MKKQLFILLLLIIMAIPTANAQQKDKLKKAHAELTRMSEERKAKKEGYVVSELLTLNIISGVSAERDLNKRNKRSAKIHYSGPSTFRFYVYAETGSFQLMLRQNGEGILKKIEEPVFLDKTIDPKNGEYTVYEYYFAEDNDFIIDFKSIGEPIGCAMVVVTAESSKEAFRLKGFEISEEPIQ